MAPPPVLSPGESHGRRSLVGCSPWGREESDTTERLHFHFSLSCIGEGNGNPLQCSCLETPRDGGAWWAAVSGVAESRTRLKRLSSSSSKGTGRSCSQVRDSGFIHEMCCDLDSALPACLVSTLCNPKGCSPPGSSVHGTSQERLLERVASSSSRGPS